MKENEKKEVRNDIIYSQEKMLLAERLATLIKANGCTHKWLCDHTRLDRKSLRRLLAGRENQTDDTRMKILGALGLSLRYYYDTPELDIVLISLTEAEKIVCDYLKEELSRGKAAEGEKAA